MSFPDNIENSELDELYTQVIFDHYKNPRNKRALNKFSFEHRGFNPLCGDEIIIQLNISELGLITDVSFQGTGCSISQASASILTEIVKNKSVEEVQLMINDFRGILESNQKGSIEFDDLKALEGVKKFPVRIKCALLSWVTLEEILEIRS
tara:strand:+ start:352 stop:804 length:453 start_codon:yes stop_codon:yes gene_type:complete